MVSSGRRLETMASNPKLFNFQDHRALGVVTAVRAVWCSLKTGILGFTCLICFPVIKWGLPGSTFVLRWLWPRISFILFASAASKGAGRRVELLSLSERIWCKSIASNYNFQKIKVKLFFSFLLLWLCYFSQFSIYLFLKLQVLSKIGLKFPSKVTVSDRPYAITCFNLVLQKF